MFRIFRHYVPKTLVLLGIAELLILFVSIYLGASLDLTARGQLTASVGNHLPLWIQATVFAAAIVLGMTAMGLYHRDQHTRPSAVMIRLLLSFLCGFALMGTAYLAIPTLILGGSVFATALVSSFIGIATCRLICAAHDEEEQGIRVLVLGVGDRAKQIERLQGDRGQSNVVVAGYVDVAGDEHQIKASAIAVGEHGSLLQLAQALKIDEVIVATDDRRRGLPVDDILQCKMYGIGVLDVSDFYERQLGKIGLDTLHPSNVIFADGFTQAVIKGTEKRALDIFAGATMLALTAPIMLLTALAIRYESRGPILYRQVRVGHRGQNFTLLKFRSMRTDAEQNGAVWAMADDDRATRVGAFIRRTRIDELPQLINVLAGDMSFVGPRPERPEFVKDLTDQIPYYDLRHYVKPGITGWAQILYPYGASVQDAREKLQYDLYYLKNYSIFLDINILLQTIQVILWRKGAR